MKNILVVEDTASFVHYLQRYLERDGYHVYVAHQGKEALELLDRHTIDLVLLDLMLPDADGLQLCEQIRDENPALPVMIISRVEDTGSKVQALHSCADDYIVKDADMEEVLERIRLVFRHSEGMHSGAEKHTFTAGPLSLNFEQRSVTLNGQEVSLTRREYDLLHMLVIHEGKILPYDTLLRRVWGDSDTVGNQIIHAYVNHLRKKIEQPVQRRFIYNHQRMGYRFKADEKPR